MFSLVGGAPSEAHPVTAAPPETSGLRAQLPSAADLGDQDGEACPGHQTHLSCESPASLRPSKSLALT